MVFGRLAGLLGGGRHEEGEEYDDEHIEDQSSGESDDCGSKNDSEEEDHVKETNDAEKNTEVVAGLGTKEIEENGEGSDENGDGSEENGYGSEENQNGSEENGEIEDGDAACEKGELAEVAPETPPAVAVGHPSEDPAVLPEVIPPAAVVAPLAAVKGHPRVSAGGTFALGLGQIFAPDPVYLESALEPAPIAAVSQSTVLGFLGQMVAPDPKFRPGKVNEGSISYHNGDGGLMSRLAAIVAPVDPKYADLLVESTGPPPPPESFELLRLPASAPDVVGTKEGIVPLMQSVKAASESSESSAGSFVKVGAA